MLSFSYIITDPEGLHARPAGVLAKTAQKFECDVRLTRGDTTVDAKRIFSLMKLAVKRGETIVFSADGPDEADAITVLRSFCESELDFREN